MQPVSTGPDGPEGAEDTGGLSRKTLSPSLVLQRRPSPNGKESYLVGT